MNTEHAIPKKFKNIYHAYNQTIRMLRNFEITFLYDIRHNMILAATKNEKICMQLRNLCNFLTDSSLITITMPEREFTPKELFWLYNLESNDIDIAKSSRHFSSPSVTFTRSSTQEIAEKFKKNDKILNVLNKLMPLCIEIDGLNIWKENMIGGIDTVSVFFPELKQLIDTQKNHSLIKDLDERIDQLFEECRKIKNDS